MKTFEDFNINVRPGAGQHYTQCPRCSHDRKKKQVKCLSVNTDDGIWNCHHCAWTGSLKGQSKTYTPHWNKPEFRKPQLLRHNNALPIAAATFFTDRSISLDVVKRNRVTVQSVYMPQVEEFVTAIGFPFYKDGEHINTKWRDRNKNFRMETGAERILFGLDDIKTADTSIWVEGEMDKLALETAGFLNVVSPPDGAPSEKSKSYGNKFSFLDSAMDLLKTKKHILFVDSDAPGQRLEQELARRLGKVNCSVVRLPKGHKDANDYLIAAGVDNLKAAVQNAQPIPIEGIYHGRQLFNDLIRLRDGGFDRGHSTGFEGLDQLFTVRAGELTVVTGIPNHGKSNFIDCLMVNMAIRDNWGWAIFSPENQPIARHAANLVEKYTQVPYLETSPDDVAISNEFIDNHFHWILPDVDANWDLQSILEMAQTLVERNGVNGLIIDPWNEIDHKRPASLTETEYISKCLSVIKRFAREFDVHVFLIAHPAKLYKNKNDEYPVPTPYDISGSANWKNKTDNAITVYRDFYAKPTLSNPHNQPVFVYVQKIRFKEIGRVGFQEFRYLPKTSTYEEVLNGI